MPCQTSPSCTSVWAKIEFIELMNRRNLDDQGLAALVEALEIDVHALPPLHKACIEGDEAQVTTLLKAGADVNETTATNEKPLELAILGGNVAVVETLLKNNASPAFTRHGGSLHHLAVSQGQLDICSVLLKHHRQCDSSDNVGFSPLQLASKLGYLEIVQLLVINGADYLNPSFKRKTARECAQSEGHFHVATYLQEQELNTSNRFEKGRNVLHLASMRGFLQLVQHLVERGADVDAQDEEGNTALFLACQNRQEDVVQVLIRHASLDVPNKSGFTALRRAALYREPAIFEALVNAGAKQWAPHETLDALQSPVESVVFNKSDDFLACGTRAGHVLAWNRVPPWYSWLRASWKKILDMNDNGGSIYNVRISELNQIGCASEDGSARRWTCAGLLPNVSWTKTMYPQQSAHVNCVSFSKYMEFATGSSDGLVRLYNFDSVSLLDTLDITTSCPDIGHQPVTCLAFSDKQVVYGRTDARIIFWGFYSTTPQVVEVGWPGAISALEFSCDGRLACGSSHSKIGVYDNSGNLQLVIESHSQGVTDVSFSPNGNLLASASPDGTVKIWDAFNGSLLHTITGHIGEVLSVAFAPSGEYIASGGVDGKVRIWWLLPEEKLGSKEDSFVFITHEDTS